MARPYSMDLRERVVAAITGGLSRRQAAAHFGVSYSAAIAWMKRVKETGSVAPGQMGGQKPKKHKPFDQYCADHDVFVVENLDNMDALLERSPKPFLVYTAPVNRQDMSGLPCRVFAEIPD